MDEFLGLMNKLTERINKVGIISRAWDDEEIKNTLKAIEKIVLDVKNNPLQIRELPSYIWQIKENPSIKFYNIHIPTAILNLVYSPNEMVEYTIKNQLRMSLKELGFIGGKLMESNDENALNKFAFNIKRIGKTNFVDSVIEREDENLMTMVALNVSGDSFKKIQEKILNSNNIKSILRLAMAKGADLKAIKDFIINSEDVDFMYRLANLKNSADKFVLSVEDRNQLFEIIIEKILAMDINSIINYTNKFKENYSREIAERFINNCDDPKDFITFALLTGYGKNKAVDIVINSGDVDLICSVILTLASKEKTQKLYSNGISISTLFSGLLNSKKEDIIANKAKVQKVFDRYALKLKNRKGVEWLREILESETEEGIEK